MMIAGDSMRTSATVREPPASSPRFATNCDATTQNDEPDRRYQKHKEQSRADNLCGVPRKSGVGERLATVEPEGHQQIQREEFRDRGRDLEIRANYANEEAQEKEENCRIGQTLDDVVAHKRSLLIATDRT